MWPTLGKTLLLKKYQQMFNIRSYRCGFVSATEKLFIKKLYYQIVLTSKKVVQEVNIPDVSSVALKVEKFDKNGELNVQMSL